MKQHHLKQDYLVVRLVKSVPDSDIKDYIKLNKKQDGVHLVSLERVRHDGTLYKSYQVVLHDNIGDKDTAPNDTAYKRCSCHSGFKLLCKLCRTSPPPAMGARFTVFWACRPCWMAGAAAHKSGVMSRPIQVRQL